MKRRGFAVVNMPSKGIKRVNWGDNRHVFQLP